METIHWAQPYTNFTALQPYIKVLWQNNHSTHAIFNDIISEVIVVQKPVTRWVELTVSLHEGVREAARAYWLQQWLALRSKSHAADCSWRGDEHNWRLEQLSKNYCHSVSLNLSINSGAGAYGYTKKSLTWSLIQVLDSQIGRKDSPKGNQWQQARGFATSCFGMHILNLWQWYDRIW